MIIELYRWLHACVGTTGITSKSAVLEVVDYYAAKCFVKRCFPPIFLRHQIGQRFCYNITAGSFNTRKQYSRLLSMKKSNQFNVQKLRSGVFEPQFGGLRGNYAPHLYLFEST